MGELEQRLGRLEEKLVEFAEQLRFAYQYIRSDTGSSLTKARLVMEKVLLDIYRREMNQEPRKPLLAELLTDNQFTRKLERRIVVRINAIREIGNFGPHGEPAKAEDALRVLDDLCLVLDWYVERYALQAPVALPDPHNTSTKTGQETPVRPGVQALGKPLATLATWTFRRWIVVAGAVLLACVGIWFLFIRGWNRAPLAHTIPGIELSVSPLSPTSWSAHSDSVLDLSYDSASTYAVSCGGDDYIRIWNVATQREISGWKVPRENGMGLRSVCFATPEDLIIAGHMDGSLTFWRWQHGKQVRHIPSPGPPQIRCVRVCPSNKSIVASWEQGPVAVLAPYEKNFTFLGGKEFQGNGFALSRDGRRIAIGGVDGGLKIWNLDSHSLVKELSAHKGDHREIWAVAISPDGTAVATCGRHHNVVRVWHVERGDLIGEYEGYPGPVMCLQFCANGTLAMCAGGGPNGIHLWDVATGQKKGEWKGQKGRIDTLLVSSDNRLVFSGSNDGSISMWKLDKVD